MWIPVLLLLVGLVLLIKGGDWFVDGASGIARRFYLPEILTKLAPYFCDIFTKITHKMN